MLCISLAIVLHCYFNPPDSALSTLMSEGCGCTPYTSDAARPVAHNKSLGMSSLSLSPRIHPDLQICPAKRIRGGNRTYRAIACS